jgi:hypothetical protein
MKTMAKTCWKTLGHFIAYLRECGKVYAERGVKGWKLTIFQQMVGNDGFIESEEPIYERPKRNWNEKFTKYGSKKTDQPIEVQGLPTAYAGAGGSAAALMAAPKLAGAAGTDRLENVKVQGFVLKKKAAPVKASSKSGIAGDGSASAGGITTDAGPSAKKARLVFSLDDENNSSSSSSSSSSSGSSGGCSSTGSGGGCSSDGYAKEVWPRPCMVVKVYDKTGAAATKGWHKRKGAVVRVLNGPSPDGRPKKSSAIKVEIKATDGSGETAVVPMSVLETVLPKPGSRVLLCQWRHEHNGKLVRLKAIHEDKFCASVQLNNGTVLGGIQYEWICKVTAAGEEVYRR